MFVVTNIFDAVASILHMLVSAYMLVVLVACVLSWFRVDPYNPAVRVIWQITEPVFNFVRRKIPFSRVGQVDLSPLFVIIALELVDMIVIRSIAQFGHSLS